MTILSSLILGLIQGVSEFLPISSSGHLAIAGYLMGEAGIGAVPDFFDVLLHLGTLVAVFVAYWYIIKIKGVYFGLYHFLRNMLHLSHGHKKAWCSTFS